MRELARIHVEAPDGPFARYNPWLPFLATGLVPPPASPANKRLGVVHSHPDWLVEMWTAELGADGGELLGRPGRPAQSADSHPDDCLQFGGHQPDLGG